VWWPGDCPRDTTSKLRDEIKDLRRELMALAEPVG
jgi:hypothetical protein